MRPSYGGDGMNYIEIGNDQDKRTVAGILVMNGYVVRLEVVKQGNRNKRVIAFEKKNGGKTE